MTMPISDEHLIERGNTRALVSFIEKSNWVRLVVAHLCFCNLAILLFSYKLKINNDQNFPSTELLSNLAKMTKAAK